MERQPGPTRVQRFLAVTAWIGLVLIAFVTLSPIGLRPHVGGPNNERLIAFLVVGGLFGLAYPRKLWLVAGIIVAVALGLEVLQHLVPGRHGRMWDAVVKSCGAVAGVAGAALLNQLTRRF